MSGGRVESRFLEDFDTRTGPNSGGTGGNHELKISERPNAARRFDTQTVGSHLLTQQGHIGNGRTGRAEAGGGFHEVGTARNAEFTGQNFFSIGQQTSFKNDFAAGPGRLTELGHSLDICENRGNFTIFESANIQHHINFTGAITESRPSFNGFGLNQVGAEWKADHRTDEHGCVLEQRSRLADIDRIYADRTELVVHSFLAKPVDISSGGRRLEECMINEAGDVHGRVRMASGRC